MTGERADRLRLVAVLVVLALVMAGFAFGMAGRSGPVPTSVQRDDVQSAARDGVQALLTFSPTTSPADRAAVAELLTGRLANEYRVIGPDVVVPGAVAARLTSTARVVGVGTAEYAEAGSRGAGAEPARARLLVFVDQQVTVPERPTEENRTPDQTPDQEGVGEPEIASTARWASMRMVDGNWRLADLTGVGGMPH